MTVRAASLFSGIGAPEAARPDWHWLWSAEIEPFPAAVLAARHPHSVNLGDVTAHDFAERALAVGRPDVLVFGSPCQSFSTAGKRLGLDDPRGNLALVALAVVRRVRPQWFVFENVPGLLSSAGGEDFAAFLGAVRECGYLGCGRMLDAQYWNVAQRRERLFFVGCLGDWRGPAEVLSLRESLYGHPPPRRETRQEASRPLATCPAGGSGYRNDADTADNLIASTLRPRHGGGGWPDPLRNERVVAYGGNDTRGPIEVATALNAHGGPHGRLDFESETFIASVVQSPGPATGGTFSRQECRGGGLIPSPTAGAGDARGHESETFVAQEPIAFNWQTGGDFRPCCGPITTALQREQTSAVMVGTWQGGSNQDQVCSPDGVAPTLAFAAGTHGGHHQPKAMGAAIRRLTPVECERLMGLPDFYTAITYRGKEPPDGPRYRAIGNSMAVPVLRWLLTRIEAQLATQPAREAAA